MSSQGCTLCPSGRLLRLKVASYLQIETIRPQTRFCAARAFTTTIDKVCGSIPGPPFDLGCEFLKNDLKLCELYFLRQ